jgi:hypothetical protein
LKEVGSDFKPFNDAGNQTYSVSQSFQLEKDEPIYGLGILQNGKMSQRNTDVKMIQNNTWDFVPFFQSVKGYGIFGITILRHNLPINRTKHHSLLKLGKVWIIILSTEKMRMV